MSEYFFTMNEFKISTITTPPPPPSFSSSFPFFPFFPFLFLSFPFLYFSSLLLLSSSIIITSSSSIIASSSCSHSSSPFHLTYYAFIFHLLPQLIHQGMMNGATWVSSGEHHFHRGKAKEGERRTTKQAASKGRTEKEQPKLRYALAGKRKRKKRKEENRKDVAPFESTSQGHHRWR